MAIRRKIIKYNTKRKYMRLFFIAVAVLLISNFISGFDMSAKLKQSLAGNEVNASQVNISKATIENGVQVIRMTADNNGYTPNAIYVEKDIPVRLVIEGNQLNACNDGVAVKSFNIEKDLMSGENIIEFTLKGEDIDFSCWMGMIKGKIKVI
ncbi:hypothetical protein CBU02nite_34850 [Clostridium butyricum]|jgi:hypothetical protein|uniref:EfeO-type cupredoxin-like domain-containing protein n=1 Tax=Clostridium butyricum TaxID=1492 RepID=A0A512TRW6_CLOBU|nr:hypothetical protein [Clostridium butyricum]NOW22647.1 hypothetical protein [Clostridium butyricum]GEQ22979.1 hypothetical protein CBU02nite_34850 [Clostridium butyricum]